MGRKKHSGSDDRILGPELPKSLGTYLPYLGQILEIKIQRWRFKVEQFYFVNIKPIYQV